MTAIFHGLRSFCIPRLPALVFLLLCVAPAWATDDGAASLATPSFLPDEAFARVNASARGLAGQTVSGGASWESTAEWGDYQKWLDVRWSYITRVRLSAMRNWSNAELGGLRGETSTVFYPFSGPDFLYVNTVFPDSKYLLMAGLEPVGSMPDLAKLQDEGKFAAYIGQVKTSLNTILVASFFKTKDMKTDFNNQMVDGLMPVIVAFLARQGYTIDAIDDVTLGHDGSVHHRGEASGAPGVQIAYGDRSDLHYLLYFQVDLGNDGLHDNPGFVRLMQKLGPGITYLKAASYLLYEDYFSTIRNGILDNSLAVVEDDSGIPLHDFKPDEWDVIPYGNYTGPITLFKDHYQPDLTDFYARTPHSPLPFGSGYKFAAAFSSLLVAKKK
ncbi:MAG: hypothetical protein LV481_01225 [Methylacidiphilales bacterium]|nr:hypothetical protein [Candidatus Methylacidiphilales bacterium]